MGIFDRWESIDDSLKRIADALERQNGIEHNVTIKPEDFKKTKLFAESEEKQVHREDSELQQVISERLDAVSQAGGGSFFEEDDVSDIMEEINQS